MTAAQRARTAPVRQAALLALPPISETEFQGNVCELAATLGWEFYHTHNSRRSQPGWPDLVLGHERQKRLLVVELKKAIGVVSPEQTKWLRLIANAGHECAVWRPADMASGLIPAVLSGRRRLDGAR